MLLKRYLQTPFRDLESYLRFLTGLNEDDIQLILEQYNSKFKTYKISPAVYTFKDLSEVLSRSFKTEFEIRNRQRSDHKYDKSDSILIDGDNVSSITKLTTFGVKNYSSIYYSEKSLKISSRDEIHLKSDVIDGGFQNRLKQLILYSFVLDKPPGYKLFCSPETFHYKRTKKVL